MQRTICGTITELHLRSISTCDPASFSLRDVQAASEFWAVMRHTHGFQNQAAGPQVQATAANEVAHSPAPGTSSRQQAETFLESLGNRKRRGGSNDEYTHPTNHLLDTIIARPAKRNKEFTGEYTKPNTTATPHGNTPASDSGDAASLTGEYAEPNTTATPTGHNPDVGNRDTASLPAIEEEKNVRTTTAFWNVMQTTHGFQNQTAATTKNRFRDSSQTPNGSLPREPQEPNKEKGNRR
jgi:hypothetical protein